MSDNQAQASLPDFTPGGPYLALAVVCEKLLREADGVTSLIRLIDRVIVQLVGPSAPAQMPPAPINLILVLEFKSGFARGPYSVTVKLVAPSHQTLSTWEFPMLLEGDDRGTQIGLNFVLVAQEEGVYWFDVLVMGALITRVPLRIVYQRLSMSALPNP